MANGADRLTDVSTFYEAPPEVITQLRAIDPVTELVYVGKGRWWLGRVDPHTPAVEAGRQDLLRCQHEGALWPTLRKAMLKSQGFKRVLLWDVNPRTHQWEGLTRIYNEASWGHWIAQFRLQDWVYRHWPNSDSAWNRLMLRHEMGMMDTKLQQKISQVLDMVHADRKIILKRVRREKFFTGLGGLLKRRAS